MPTVVLAADVVWGSPVGDDVYGYDSRRWRPEDLANQAIALFPRPVRPDQHAKRVASRQHGQGRGFSCDH